MVAVTRSVSADARGADGHCIDRAGNGGVHPCSGYGADDCSSRYGSEDFVSAGLEFQTGAVGSLVARTASFPGGAESIVAHGPKGSARLDSGKLVITFRDGRFQVFGEETATGAGTDPMVFVHAWHQAIYEDFSDAVGDDREPVASGHDALIVQALIETLVQSSREGRAVSVPAPEIV